ncbi:MAG: hypothetical protein K2X38_01635 [Gemmataceae bacterium]|nr:hypothetical protein [Gemmataceae bacterium]
MRTFAKVGGALAALVVVVLLAWFRPLVPAAPEDSKPLLFALNALGWAFAIAVSGVALFFALAALPNILKWFVVGCVCGVGGLLIIGLVSRLRGERPLDVGESVIFVSFWGVAVGSYMGVSEWWSRSRAGSTPE